MFSYGFSHYASLRSFFQQKTHTHTHTNTMSIHRQLILFLKDMYNNENR